MLHVEPTIAQRTAPATAAKATLPGCVALLPLTPARAQTVEALIRRLEALQRRVDELETSQAAPAAAPTRQPTARPPLVAAPPPAPRPVTRAEVDVALQGDLPNSFRVPGTETSVRLYGFVKTNLFTDLDTVNRSDAPSVQGVPLAGSAGALQSGDTQFSARRSRIGFDTSTPTSWGPMLTKREFDFAGDLPSASGAATSSGYMPRLRQAYVQVGDDAFSVLVGQANSVWNDGFIETLTESTFSNASAVR